jgi:hypothetical protein
VPIGIVTPRRFTLGGIPRFEYEARESRRLCVDSRRSRRGDADNQSDNGQDHAEHDFPTVIIKVFAQCQHDATPGSLPLTNKRVHALRNPCRSLRSGAILQLERLNPTLAYALQYLRYLTNELSQNGTPI